MTWSAGIADTALITCAEGRLSQGLAAEAIMIVSNDGDFTSLTRTLVSAEHRVIVSGKTVSRRLGKAATEVILLNDLIPDFYVPWREILDRQKTMVLNTIPWPE
jgi:hypothetical protein